MSRRLAALLIFAAQFARAEAAQPPPPSPVEAWIGNRQEQLQRLYVDLHAHPELSFQEVETSKRIADELKKAGAAVTTNVGKLGVVGVIENGPGPVVLVRTDMDALPVIEQTGLPYASRATATDALGRKVGVMHACGHDIHMTCLVGTANWLAEHKKEWSGTVVLIAQPAEETIGGARQMLEDGLYKRFPKPNYALALHCRAESPAGDVLYRPGPMLASSTSVNVTIRGKGGHGAMPHRTVDPIVLSALAILDLQTIVAREVEPIQPAVVTVGSIHGGQKHNIISDEVKLQLTLRAYSEPVRLQLIEGIERRIHALAQAHKAPAPSLEVQEHTPATINNPDLVARVAPLLMKELGDAHVKVADPVMGAEDFALYAEQDVPIMMFWIGTIAPQRVEEAKTKGLELPGLHSALYHPEPRGSVLAGVRAMVAAVRGLLPPKSTP